MLAHKFAPQQQQQTILDTNTADEDQSTEPPPNGEEGKTSEPQTDDASLKDDFNTNAAAYSADTVEEDIDQVVGKKVQLSDEDLQTDTNNTDDKGQQRN